MQALCTDVLYDVFFVLWLSHRSALLNASLVCKIWHQIAQHILNGCLDNVVISPNNVEQNRKIFERVEASEEFQKKLHSITVRDVFSSRLVPAEMTVPEFIQPNEEQRQRMYRIREERNQKTQIQLGQLARMISKCASLCNFVWEAKPRIPAIIMDALRDSPNCRIQIQFRDDYYAHHSGSAFIFPSIETHESISLLVPIASKLTRLGVILPATEISSVDETKPPMFQTLGRIVSCAPLQSLSVHAAGLLHSSSDFHSVTNIGWLTDNIELPLQVQEIRLSNICLCDASALETDAFRKSICWHNVRSVHFTCPSMLSLISPDCQLTSLTVDLDPPYEDLNVSCTKTPSFQSIRAFILSQHRLTHLSVSQGHQVFETDNEALDHALIRHLGHTIRSLAIHEIEAPYPLTKKRLALLPKTLVTIGATCPHLRSLNTPMPDEDAAGVFYANCIKKHLTQLHHLTLTLSLEQPGQYPGRTPVNLQRSVDMWSHLLTPYTGLTLRTLLVCVGAKCSNERLGKQVWDPMREYQRRFIVQKPEQYETKDDTLPGVVWANCVELDDFLAAQKYGDRTTYAAYNISYLDILQRMIADGLGTRGFGEDDF
ncbi:hypothetical protein K505DRAFT_414109 [Melanomma pulvis-pyrius CBS 109.77]|uniref:Uncharacterized protein n=1 Tax=Melanomma pulvis-pyrius CBS 109.77 TaxID=1314802 RepID=A0A6A6XT97_9PLEO|nr:hypothetical protein K505DRAFT_414109 [Melanomma pulvis-pyrius CBS 109.77]